MELRTTSLTAREAGSLFSMWWSWCCGGRETQGSQEREKETGKRKLPSQENSRACKITEHDVDTNNINNQNINSLQTKQIIKRPEKD